ncbi:hypothetical protein H8D51_01115 [bacterium]|nr:hypothetical protein [bacterium]
MNKHAAILIVNACIWGFVIIATALALKGTDSYAKIQLILAGGAAASLVVVSIGTLGKKKK